MAEEVDSLARPALIARIEQFAPSFVVYRSARAELFGDLEGVTSCLPAPGESGLDLYQWTLGQIVLAHLECVVVPRSASESGIRLRQYRADRKKLEKKLKAIEGHRILARFEYKLYEAVEMQECQHGRSRNECEVLYAQREMLEIFRATGVIHVAPKHYARLLSERAYLLELPSSAFCEPNVLPARPTEYRGRGAPRKDLQNRLLGVLVPAWKEAGLESKMACRFVARILASCFPERAAINPPDFYDVVENLADALGRQSRRLTPRTERNPQRPKRT
jgi:hypothetical protein